MKKLAIGILTMALLLACGTSAVYAAGSVSKSNTTGTYKAEVCNYSRTSCAYADDGSVNVCYNHKADHSNSCLYADENQDGICDNHTDSVCRQTSTGHGHGHRGNHHR